MHSQCAVNYVSSQQCAGSLGLLWCVCAMCGRPRLEACRGGRDLWQILPALREEEEEKGEEGQAKERAVEE